MYGNIKRLSSDNVEIKQYLERLEDRIQELTDALLTQYSTLHASENEHDSPYEDQSHSRMVDETLSVAEDVKSIISSSSTHERRLSFSSTVPDLPGPGIQSQRIHVGSAERRPFGNSNGASSAVLRGLPQPSPNSRGLSHNEGAELSPRHPTDDSTDDDVVQRFIDSAYDEDLRLPSPDMILHLEGYGERGLQHLQNQEFRKAQRELQRAFRYGIQAKKQSRRPFHEQHDIGLGLAAATMGLCEYENAEKWLDSLSSPATGDAVRDAVRVGEIKYNKALLHRTMYLRQSNRQSLDRLIESAQISYEHSAMHPGQFLALSAEIMYDVSMHDGDEVAMQIWRRQNPTAIELPEFGYPRGIESDEVIPSPEFSNTHTFTSDMIFSRIKDGTPQQVVEILQSQADLEQKDEAGRTPLLVATEHKRIEVCRLLLEDRHGRVSIYAQDNQGLTAMHIAIQQSDSDASDALVELLLAHGPDINATDKDGSTLLHFCAFRNKPNSAKRLLSMGAIVDIRDKVVKETALGLAMRTPRINIVMSYLSANIEIDAEHMSMAPPIIQEQIRNYHQLEQRPENRTNIQRQISNGSYETRSSSRSWLNRLGRRGSASRS